ncbi:glutathione S-transferase family protein [Sphingobium sp.]|uniref:glutathione S-transferase family protein n=1 Tax=Sphingobium sp. TaxID=1912891 RepID=UPI002C2647A3|nr:glutathione S-transferase family protein [Sphingobium sp.]HUD94372.1 glutathione S-transferase family protein [Sphingobium sp.]
MSYTLITANRNYSSWSLRPWLLMKALHIPFEDRIEPFVSATNYAAFRSFSPTGQVPALIDGERIVWDSLGITLYLADRHPGVWPADEAARAFAQCAATEMHSGFTTLRNDCTMNVGVRVEPHMHSPSLNKDIARLRELWEQGLDYFGGPFLAGKVFTAIDAFYAPVAFRVRTYGLDVGPIAQAWVDHMLAHPAMLQWEKEALAETWREESHEAEIGAAGRIIEDYRAS